MMVWIKRILGSVLLLLVAAWLVSWMNLRFSTHEYAELSEQELTIAKQYLEGKLTPAPAGWRWATFYPEPGVNLRTGLIEHPQAKGVVVVVPGFTGTIEMIMREIDQIYAAGFSVAAIEYRGQGASFRPLVNPEKGYVEDYGVLGADLAKYAQAVAVRGQPLFFYSISMGAHITMRMAFEQSPSVDGYALVVPMIKINTGDFDYDLAYRLSRVATGLGLGSAFAPGQSAWPPQGYVFGAATDCNANPEYAQSQGALFAERKELRTGGTTFRWIKETAESSDYLRSHAAELGPKVPVKLFTAGIDTLVDTEAASAFCSSLSSCEEIHKPTARHCITREDMDLYDGIIQESIAHFEAIAAGKLSDSTLD